MNQRNSVRRFRNQQAVVRVKFTERVSIDRYFRLGIVTAQQFDFDIEIGGNNDWPIAQRVWANRHDNDCIQ